MFLSINQNCKVQVIKGKPTKVVWSRVIDDFEVMRKEAEVALQSCGWKVSVSNLIVNPNIHADIFKTKKEQS